MIMKNRTKAFSRSLYNQHDHAGKQFVAKVLRKKHGEDLEIMGDTGFGVDLKLYKNGESEPNVSATEIEIFEGLESESVNCWPSVNFDVGAINNFLNKFLPAGFYYKTFMWPKSFWYKIYEPFIRKAAGFGVASIKHDNERYEHKYEY